MKLYYPGKGGAYRSLLSTPDITTYINDDNLSSMEMEFLDLYGRKNLLVINEDTLPHNSEIDIAFYSCDKDAYNFVKRLIEKGNNIIYYGSPLTLERMENLTDVSTKMRDKKLFYKLVYEIMPSMYNNSAKTFRNFSEFENEINNVVSYLKFPLIVKSSPGKGGKGNLVCYNKHDLDLAINIVSTDFFSFKTEYGYRATELPFIVEEYYDNALSFNATFECGTQSSKEVFISEQIIDEVFYRGNRSLTSLSDEEIETIKLFTERFKSYIQNNYNYCGWAGIDFIKTPYGIKALEINPRVNSSTHLFLIAQNPFILKAFNHSSKDGIALFNHLKPFLYNPEKMQGILPYEISPNKLLLLYFAESNNNLSQEMHHIVNSRLKLKEVKQTKYGSYSLSISYYIENLKWHQILNEDNITHYIVISTEDDKHLVKGGIGTYLGILTKYINRIDPLKKVIWITESPNENNFEEQDGNIRRYYLSRRNNNTELNIQEFSIIIERKVRAVIDHIKQNNVKYKIVIESPEWEGILAQYYLLESNKNILKVSRVHTPLAVTAVLNNQSLNEDSKTQMRQEFRQMVNSDILSSPTEYVLKATKTTALKGINVDHIKQVVIPNCINLDSFINCDLSKEEALKFFSTITNIPIDEKNFNIFIVGSVEIRKGLEIIIKAIPKILQLIPSANFYFIGLCQINDSHNLIFENKIALEANKKISPGSILALIPNEYKKNVHFTGLIDYKFMPKIIKAGDIFPICYLGDNFPGVVAEIGLSNKPLITLLRGGIGEMIKDDDDNNYYALTIDGNNIDEISKELSMQINRYFNSPENGNILAQRLKELLIKKYSTYETVDKMLTTYQTVLANKSLIAIGK